MDRFKIVRNDKEIIEIYNKISEYEDNRKGWAHHDLAHVSNVSELVEKLLYNLNYDIDLIEEAKIAAILHDVGCLEGKEGHALRSYEYAKEYFKKKEMELKYKELVLEAIKIHSDGFDTNNIIALTLILSDKLDIKYTRVAKEGYNIKGMKEFYFMAKVFKAIDSFSTKMNLLPNILFNYEKWNNS